MNKKIKKAVDFQDVLKKELKNPEFKKHYDKYGKKLINILSNKTE